MIKEKIINKKIRLNINKDLLKIKNKCNDIFNKYKNDLGKMNPKDYVYFIFSSNIFYKAKDLLFLDKKLSEANNEFDSSLLILSRSVLEDFFFMFYLLSEDSKVDFRLKAYTCHNSESNITMLNSLIALASKGKFIYSTDPTRVISQKMMVEKIEEWKDYIKNQKKNIRDKEKFGKEILVFKSVEQMCQKYDKTKNITTVEDGNEHNSLEWVYNFIYRFQCMSVHPNLNDREKSFALFNEKKKKKVYNPHILTLMSDITGKIAKYDI
jgi:hypothetical protein